MPKIECVNSHKGEIRVIEEVTDNELNADGVVTSMQLKQFFVVICLRCGEELNRIDP